MIAWCPAFADFTKHETQQAIIVITFTTYSPYILKDFVEI